MPTIPTVTRCPVFVAATLLLAGCQSEEADIKAAVSKYLSAHKGYCLHVEHRTWDDKRWIKLEIDKTLRQEFLRDQQRDIAQAEALGRAGLIQINRADRSSFVGSGPVYASFFLTSFGQTFLQEGARGLDRGLCMGRQELAKIDVSTDPAADISGRTVTTVKYQFRIIDFPSWARNVDLQSAFPLAGQYGRVGSFPGHNDAPYNHSDGEKERLGLAEVIAKGTFEGRLQLFKTSKGWMWEL